MRTILALGALAWALLLPAPTATAEPADRSGERSVQEEILDILRQEGDLSEEEHARLVEKARREERDAWHFGWRDNFWLRKGDGREFSLRFGGRIQNDWTVYEPDGDLRSALGDDGFGTKFRRATLRFQGSVYELAFFVAEYNFASAANDSDGDGPFSTGGFLDVFMGLRLGDAATVKVGHQKEPMSLEVLVPFTQTLFVERSLASAFRQVRNTGIRFEGWLAGGEVTWSTGVFQETNDLGSGFEDGADQHWTSRLTWNPIYQEGGARLLHLGTGYSHEFRSDADELRYRSRPENSFAPNLVDTGALDADDADLLNLEAAANRGPWALQAEATGSWVDLQSGGANPFFWGAYAQVAYMLTGEHRPYDRKAASFGRWVPRRRLDPARGGWGAWQLAARFSYIDLSDKKVKGGKLHDVTGALNWYPFSNVRVMLNYIYSFEKDRAAVPTGDAHSALLRFQFEF